MVGLSMLTYYGSQSAKRTVAETDRVLFQMMTDMQHFSQKEDECNQEDDDMDNIMDKEKDEKKSATSNAMQRRSFETLRWRIAIVITALVVLIIVVASILVCELLKRPSPASSPMSHLS